MALYRNRRFISATLISCAIFLALLIYRVQFYGRSSLEPENGKSAHWNSDTVRTGESWMNISQNFKKIGYTHRQIEKSTNGYRIEEETVMKINTMGMAQDIHIKSGSLTGMDFSLESFDFRITSGSFDFAVKGEIKGNTLSVKSSGSGDSATGTVEIPLENRPYLTSGITRATVAAGLEPGQSMVLFIFDPSTLGQAPATVKMEGEEDIGINGKRIKAKKVSLSFKGAREYAWFDAEGQLLKEQGILGLTMTMTDRKGALDGSSVNPSEDLTALAAVDPGRTLERPEEIKSLVLKIEDLDNASALKPEGDRQSWVAADNGGTLTVKKESIENLPERLDPELLAGVDDIFRKPDPFIQSNDHRIRSFAAKATNSDSTPLKKVQDLVAWIQQNIKRQPVISIPNALSTLENRKGDCNEHAALMAAFCRALGIPAKIEAGMVYLNGKFYYHAWNSVFLGRWITVDSLFNQIPADVTHISFSSGSQQLQLDLIGIIGRIKLRIIDYSMK